MECNTRAVELFFYMRVPLRRWRNAGLHRWPINLPAEGDAAHARDASGLRVGVAVTLDDSPGLELSDGAMFS